MKLIIDRKQWLHGEGCDDDTSKLLREEDGKKCCIGFYALASGHSTDDIINLPCPWDVKNWKGFGNNKITARDYGPIYKIYRMLMVRNDSVFPSDEEREEQIKQLFLELDGTEVEFIGEY